LIRNKRFWSGNFLDFLRNKQPILKRFLFPEEMSNRLSISFLIFQVFFCFWSDTTSHSGRGRKKIRNMQPFFEKFLNVVRNKHHCLKTFLNKQAFSKSPHVLSEVPLYRFPITEKCTKDVRPLFLYYQEGRTS